MIVISPLFQTLILCLLITSTKFGSFNSREDSHHQYEVVIVGGGLAGLSTLSYLVQNDLKNVILFEATSRIGGRVYSFETDQGPLELGAQWIHGPNMNNSVFKLATEYKLVEDVIKCQTYEAKQFILSNGTKLNDQVLIKIYEDIHAIEDPPPGVNLENYLNEEFRKLMLNYEGEKSGLKGAAEEVFNTEKVRMIFDEGFELDKLYKDPYYIESGSDLDLNGSNGRLIDRLAKEGGLNRIQTDSPVKQIVLDKEKNRLNLFVSTSGQQVRQVSTEYAIFTPSLAVLRSLAQSSRNFFDPPLPGEKLKAGDQLQFGEGVKIFLIYTKPFWTKGTFGPLVLGCTNSDYFEGKQEWVKRVVSIDEVFDVSNTLMTVVFGKSSCQVEQLSSKVVGQIITDKIRKYTKNSSIPYPSQVIKSNWISDPFYGGTYTSPKGNISLSDFALLGRPEMSGKLLFAGEATSPHFYSTMNGARDSGLREAKRVLELLRK